MSASPRPAGEDRFTNGVVVEAGVTGVILDITDDGVLFTETFTADQIATLAMVLTTLDPSEVAPLAAALSKAADVAAARGQHTNAVCPPWCTRPHGHSDHHEAVIAHFGAYPAPRVYVTVDQFGTGAPTVQAWVHTDTTGGAANIAGTSGVVLTPGAALTLHVVLSALDPSEVVRFATALNGAADQTRAMTAHDHTIREAQPADARFTHGLLDDVFKVLDAHGYTRPADGSTLVGAALAVRRLAEAYEGQARDAGGEVRS